MKKLDGNQMRPILFCIFANHQFCYSTQNNQANNQMPRGQIQHTKYKYSKRIRLFSCDNPYDTLQSILKNVKKSFDIKADIYVTTATTTTREM